MRKSKSRIALALIALVALTSAASAEVTVYLFWGKGCPHCAKEKEFLKKLEEKYPVKIEEFEVYESQQNRSLFSKFVNAYGISPPYGVPTTFIGDEYIVGFDSDETTGKEIEEVIQRCLSQGCPDKGKEIVGKTPGFTLPIFALSLLLFILFRRNFIK